VCDDPTEAAPFELIGYAPQHVDELCRQSDLPIPVVSATLAMLELKGLIRQAGAMTTIMPSESIRSTFCRAVQGRRRARGWSLSYQCHLITHLTPGVHWNPHGQEQVMCFQVYLGADVACPEIPQRPS
jgi:hypothetical protein